MEKRNGENIYYYTELILIVTFHSNLYFIRNEMSTLGVNRKAKYNGSRN